jgi:hypothetical protein
MIGQVGAAAKLEAVFAHGAAITDEQRRIANDRQCKPRVVTRTPGVDIQVSRTGPLATSANTFQTGITTFELQPRIRLQEPAHNAAGEQTFIQTLIDCRPRGSHVNVTTLTVEGQIVCIELGLTTDKPVVVGDIVVRKRIVNAAGSTKYAKQALRRVAPAQVTSPLKTEPKPRLVRPGAKRLVVVFDIDIGLDRQVFAKRQAQLAGRTRPENRITAARKRASIGNVKDLYARGFSTSPATISPIAASRSAALATGPETATITAASAHEETRAILYPCKNLVIQCAGSHSQTGMRISSKKRRVRKRLTLGQFFDVQSPSSTAFHSLAAPVTDTSQACA